MRFGCCMSLGSFVPNSNSVAQSKITSTTVADFLAFLSTTGYDFAECTVNLAMHPPEDDFAALQSVISAAAIPVPAFNSFIPPSLPLVGPSRDIVKVRDFVSEAFSRIAQLGGRIVVFGSGAARRSPEGYSFSQAQAEIFEFLSMAAQLAATHGITIVVEPLNKAETNMIHTVGEGLELAQMVGHPNVGALADTYHMEMAGENQSVVISVGKQLSHVHVADTDRRAPGTGSYDFRRLRECLVEGNYTGDISVECRWSDFRAEAPAALSALKQAWARA